MRHWKTAVVSPGVSLEEAIEVLDRAALRIVLVTDEHERLLGTLTDGDVRRALIRQLPMSVAVEEVMNPDPYVASPTWSPERLLRVMESHQVLQLPVVDKDRRIVGLKNLHDLLNQKTHDNPVFLMAGGFGTRLRPLTNDCPKPMLKVGDTPILELILRNFVQAGFHRFYISTHYMPDVIRNHFGDGSDWGVKIQYIHEEEPLGTGGALGLLPQNEIDLPLVLMNGDLLTSLSFENLLQFHNEHPASATMCVREYEYQVPYGVIEGRGHHIVSMIEKPVQRFFVNAGIYILDPEMIRLVTRNQRIDMPTLLEQEISENRKVNMFPLYEDWLDIGRVDDFERAKQEVEGALK